MKNNFITSQLITKLIDSIYNPDSVELFIKQTDVPSYRNGAYLVKFSRLSKNSNVIVYNYIHYGYLFVDSLTYFLVNKNNFSKSRTFSEWGDYILILDNSIGFSDNIRKIVESPNKYNEYYKDWISNHDKHEISDLDLSKKMVFSKSKKEIADLLSISLSSDYKDFTFKLFDIISNSDSIEDKDILKDCVFFIKDMNTLLSLADELNINQGPQKWRGESNSCSNFLSYIDSDYREHLHSNIRVLEKEIDKTKFKLDTSSIFTRKMFSYKNIHMRLGGVRWYSTTINDTIKNRQELFQNNYRLVSEILEKHSYVSSEEAQKEIEITLRNQENIFTNSLALQTRYNFKEDAYNLFVNKHEELKSLLTYPKDSLKFNTKFSSTKYIPLVKEIINTLGTSNVAYTLLSFFMTILSKEGINHDKEIDQSYGYSTITAFHDFGVIIYNRYIYHLYKESELFKNNGSLNEFKNANKHLFTHEENFFSHMGGYFVISLKTVKLLDEVIDFHPSNSYETLHYLRVLPDVRKLLVKDNVKSYHIPQRLPMICEPKDHFYSENIHEHKLGGYLLNNLHYIEELIKEKRGYEKKTELTKDNIIISLINKLNKVPYKINIDTMNFVYKHGFDKNILIDETSPEIKTFVSNPFKRMSKENSKKYKSIMSRIVMQKNILSIADTYSMCDKIYFPLRLDFRTRIYCVTDYFDYQKSDLAKGLLLFAEPAKINRFNTEAFNYFKAYGANMFGHGLDKKSLNYRVKWVDDISKEILNFENNNIVDRAEEKVCFISFCYEYKRYIEFLHTIELTEFNTYLPIQLDATCNGYQHLALLTKETKLLSKLNLSKSSFDDNPNDFYKYLLEAVDKFIDSELNILNNLKVLTDKNNKYYQSLKVLKQIKLSRSIIKIISMRESYSAGVDRLVRETLNDPSFTIYQECDKVIYYKYLNNDVLITRNDIWTYIICMKKVVKSVAPKINLLSKYLNSIVDICVKLKFPIPWLLPSGAIIRQSYLVEKEQKLAAFSFTKAKYTFKKYLPGIYDNKKQRSAIRPNVVHALDAATIAMLYKELNNIDMFTVHDCFAVTANNVSTLISKLKLTYIKLYSSNEYILNFDNYIRKSIHDTYGDDIFKIDGKKILITKEDGKDKIIPFPDINNVINLNSNIEFLKESSYPIV